MPERTLQERLRACVVPGHRPVPNGTMLEAADAIDERDARIAELEAQLAEAVDLLRDAGLWDHSRVWWDRVSTFLDAYDAATDPQPSAE